MSFHFIFWFYHQIKLTKKPPQTTTTTTKQNPQTWGYDLSRVDRVKRLSGDNTAISATPSLHNHITVVLYCSHSLTVIWLKSWWLEASWQGDKWSEQLPVKPSTTHLDFCCSKNRVEWTITINMQGRTCTSRSIHSPLVTPRISEFAHLHVILFFFLYEKHFTVAALLLF